MPTGWNRAAFREPEKRREIMQTTARVSTIVRKLGLMLLLVGLVALAGCSCKKFEEQIALLDEQIAELQEEVGNRDATIAEREQLAADLEAELARVREASAGTLGAPARSSAAYS